MLSIASAKPYSYSFDPAHTALLIIDVQRDFVDPNGFGAVQCGNEEIFASVRDVVPVIKRVLDSSRALGMHIFQTREGHKADLSDLSMSKKDRQMHAPGGHHNIGIGDQGPMGRLLVRDEYGHDIVDELKPLPTEVVIDKPGKGSFWATDLHRKLMARGITHLILCGVTTECCVTTTAREANDRGFQCCILGDATGGFDASFVKTSLDMISSYDGLFGFTAQSEDLLSLAVSLPSSISTPPTTPPLGAVNPIDDIKLDLHSLKEIYRAGTATPRSVMRNIWERCHQSVENKTNIWIHLRSRDEILEATKTLEDKYEKASPEEYPPLFGVPFAVKDNIDVAGIPTTAACPEYAYTPTESAPIATLLQAAGAILIGKTNMDQLATGLSGCRSPYGNVCSVFGKNRISGGSSSGSAVAVAAGLVTFAIGTDTAGSGRVPAAFNGIVGFKPTKGTLSARGIVPACRSLDTASIFALSIQEARNIWHVMDESDHEKDAFAKDPNTLPLSLSDYRGLVGHFEFATPPASAMTNVQPEYLRCFQTAVDVMQKLSGTAQIEPLSDEAYKPFSVATTLLYKGTLVHERIASIGHEFIVKNMERLHPTIKSLFQAVLSRDEAPWQVFADQATQAEATVQATRLLGVDYLSKRIDSSRKLDVLLLPTVGFHPTVEEMEADSIGLNAKLGDFTHFANVLDLCAVSVNAGWTDDGMPVGVTLVAGRGMDGKLLSIAAALEKELGKHHCK